ncbi:unnamed protein product [Medioppia subpectinata]|uniref:MPN domain-containing protein n=1 Tax=Medioppia subpectinata TaxID=1979941 RepID=A0A7R9PZ08_9ACAR|nr:unnamed protein product [Medioppia subpectinata]CAG2106570.1 unnamed protein product [Medioppia subpectinata]
MPVMSADYRTTDDGLNGSDVSVAEVLEPSERIRRLVQTAGAVGMENSVPIKRYWRSGKELIRMAHIYREEQTLEKAFILYMKYITLFVEKIPQHSEYKTCEPQEKALTKNNCKQVFPIAEELKSKLMVKYQKEFDDYLQQKKRRQLEEAKRSEEQRQQFQRRQEEEKEKQLIELQLKLDKQIKEKKEIKEPTIATPNVVLPQPLSTTSVDISFGTHYPSDSTATAVTPAIDRTTKPSAFSYNDFAMDSFTRVVIPQRLIQKFLVSAQSNTNRNVETCAILGAQLANNVFTITHVIVTKQSGTADSCQMVNEEEIIPIQDTHRFMVVGWIHTHPTQNAFMSSIDLHTHWPYQQLLSESIAIVCAPKFQEVGVYSLTEPHGMQLITSCKLSGHHLHPENPPIYERSSHILFNETIDVSLIDLR